MILLYIRPQLDYINMKISLKSKRTFIKEQTAYTCKNVYIFVMYMTNVCSNEHWRDEYFNLKMAKSFQKPQNEF